QARLLGSLFAGGHNYKVWASVSQRFYWSFHQGLLPVYRLTALAVAIPNHYGKAWWEIAMFF
ncbi:hypothetical protein, partial [Nostoc sp. ChiSLP03a]|uniref:hypothetical protein n=1 Tax=Nostoc sp. ChiSLP03a TaxID=3075380 RepID=UPI002AD3442E